MYKVIDLHCETASIIYKNNNVKLRNNNLQVDLSKLKKGNYLAQVFAMFIYLKDCDPFNECNLMLDSFYKELELNQNEIKVALNYQDIIENNQQGLLSAILSIEEGAVLNGKIENLNHFYSRGVRMICLNWNFINGIGHPNFSYYSDKKIDFTTPNVTLGLTDFGLEVIKKMEELGMIIDVSHTSDKGFWDVYNNTTKPFIASHSNSRTICNHVRNLTDEMILAIKDRKGVIGINFATDFINPNAPITYVSDLVKHILHIICVGGIDVVALGTDFDGINRTTQIDNAGEICLLSTALKEAGLSNEDIEKIFYKNFLRVFKEVVG